MQKTKYKGIYKIREGILVNTDNQELLKYKMRKAKMKEDRDRMDALEADVSEVKNDLKEIKDLLKGLVK